MLPLSALGQGKVGGGGGMDGTPPWLFTVIDQV